MTQELKKKEKKLLKLNKPTKSASKRGRKFKAQNEPVADLLDIRVCYLCNSNWMTCEQCSNWSCVDCIDNYHPTMEFICDECQ